MHIYTYTYIHMCVYIYIPIYLYMQQLHAKIRRKILKDGHMFYTYIVTYLAWKYCNIVEYKVAWRLTLELLHGHGHGHTSVTPC